MEAIEDDKSLTVKQQLEKAIKIYNNLSPRVQAELLDFAQTEILKVLQSKNQ